MVSTTLLVFIQQSIISIAQLRYIVRFSSVTYLLFVRSRHRGFSPAAADQVAPQYLAPHVDRLLKALLVCFFDESWPVRDAACVASGRFAGAYPEECRPSLDKLYERFVRSRIRIGWA